MTRVQLTKARCAAISHSSERGNPCGTDSGGLKIRQASHPADLHERTQHFQIVTQPFVQESGRTENGAARIDLRESLDPVQRFEGIEGCLTESDYSAKRCGEIAPAVGFAAPRSAENPGSIGQDAYCGIVVIQELGPRKSFDPETRMGALAGAAPAKEHESLPVADNAGGMDGNGVVEQDYLGEQSPRKGGKDNSGGRS